MAWANGLRHIRPAIEALQHRGVKLDVINIGGGFPYQYVSPSMPCLKDIARNVLDAFGEFPCVPHLNLEPGRAMIADTAVLVASVIGRTERKGTTWLFLDVGVYNGLFEALACQGSTRYAVTSLRRGTNVAAFALAGPTGDGLDVIAREALLPTDTKVGDRLIVHNVGAYTLSLCSSFNGFPKPDVYYF